MTPIAMKLTNRMLQLRHIAEQPDIDDQQLAFGLIVSLLAAIANDEQWNAALEAIRK